MQKETVAKLDPTLAALAPDVDPPMAAGSGAVASAAAAANQNATVETDWRAQLRHMNPSRFVANNPFLVVGVKFRGKQDLEVRLQTSWCCCMAASLRRCHRPAKQCQRRFLHAMHLNMVAKHSTMRWH